MEVRTKRGLQELTTPWTWIPSRKSYLVLMISPFLSGSRASCILGSGRTHAARAEINAESDAPLAWQCSRTSARFIYKDSTRVCHEAVSYHGLLALNCHNVFNGTCRKLKRIVSLYSATSSRRHHRHCARIHGSALVRPTRLLWTRPRH